MGKYTLDEKVDYNKKRGDSFGINYVMGVTLYRDYVKMDKKTQAVIDSIVSSSKILAKDGDEGGKGFLCGMRDAAKDRKERQAKRNR